MVETWDGIQIIFVGDVMNVEYNLLVDVVEKDENQYF